VPHDAANHKPDAASNYLKNPPSLRENNVRRATLFPNLQNAWIIPTIISEFHQDYRKCLCAPAAAFAQRRTSFCGNILSLI
jgi:hypothetical protein